jgi:hypothetical protein
VRVSARDDLTGWPFEKDIVRLRGAGSERGTDIGARVMPGMIQQRMMGVRWEDRNAVMRERWRRGKNRLQMTGLDIAGSHVILHTCF